MAHDLICITVQTVFCGANDINIWPPRQLQVSLQRPLSQQCWRLISWLLLTFELGELNPGLDQKWDQQLEIALPLCKSRKLDRRISKVAVVIIYQIIDVACDKVSMLVKIFGEVCHETCDVARSKPLLGSVI